MGNVGWLLFHGVLRARTVKSQIWTLFLRREDIRSWFPTFREREREMQT